MCNQVIPNMRMWPINVLFLCSMLEELDSTFFVVPPPLPRQLGSYFIPNPLEDRSWWGCWPVWWLNNAWNFFSDSFLRSTKSWLNFHPHDFHVLCLSELPIFMFDQIMLHHKWYVHHLSRNSTCHFHSSCDVITMDWVILLHLTGDIWLIDNLDCSWLLQMDL